MGQFGTETRRWLESAIKQRKMLVRRNQSHKPQYDVAEALHKLGIQLDAFPYQEDRNMARFIRNHIAEIEMILPGEGSTCHEKKKRELREINKRALMLINPPSPLRGAFPPEEGEKSAGARGNMKSTELQKTIEYEKAN